MVDNRLGLVPSIHESTFNFNYSIVECPDSTLDHKKATIGRKLSRVLSLFRKKSTEEEHKDISSEPVYEELIYGNITDISSPQYSFSTLDRLDSGYSANFTDRLEPSFAEILRLGRPYPQVVGGPGWWVRGFRHRAPTLFLPTEELTPIEPAYIDTAVKIDEKANYFRTHFLNREHINLVGYSRVWGPLVLSILQDEPGYKLILRSVSGTETREVTEPDESSDWATAVFGSLSQDTFSQVRIKFNIGADQIMTTDFVNENKRLGSTGIRTPDHSHPKRVSYP